MAKERINDTDSIQDADIDKELSDILIAISVITRQLARKITFKHQQKEDKEKEDIQELPTDRTECQVKMKKGDLDEYLW